MTKKASAAQMRVRRAMAGAAKACKGKKGNAFKQCRNSQLKKRLR